jgi:hypothetical protein
LARRDAGLILAAALLIAHFVAGSPTAALAQVVVRHADGTNEGWFFAETENFRLWHQGSRAQAEEVLQTAERARTRVCRKWFGEAVGPWQPRCELNLYPSGAAYQAATGLPDRAPGFAQTRHEGERVVSRQIDLRGDWPELLTALLPHEVTHIVFADQFGSRPLPSWASEGIAVLTEPSQNIARHLRNLPRHRDEGLLLSVKDLVEQSGYPNRYGMGAFYAQSVSLVQFLEKEKGPEALTAFLRCARRAGMAPALRRHYGMTFEELEQRWQQHAFHDSSLAKSE